MIMYAIYIICRERDKSISIKKEASLCVFLLRFPSKIPHAFRYSTLIPNRDVDHLTLAHRCN